MNENIKRLMTVAGALFTATAIALAALAFVAIHVYAATATIPPLSDIVPDADGTSVLPLPEGGNVDTGDRTAHADTTRVPSTVLPESSTVRPSLTPSATTAPDTSEAGGDDGGGILGAVIAVIAVVAVILVVIALIPRKKQ